MAIDRVKPLKIESPDTGGTDVDLFPTSLNHNEDYVDARGLAIQDAVTNDEATVISRSGDDMLFKDTNNPADVTLTQLLAGGSDERVKVSFNDTTAARLGDKLVAGTGVTITEQNDGANETLQISATGSSGDTDTLHHLIITTAGGIVYDTVGEVVHKVSP